MKTKSFAKRHKLGTPPRLKQEAKKVSKPLNHDELVEQEVAAELERCEQQFNQYANSVQTGNDPFNQLRVELKGRILFLTYIATTPNHRELEGKYPHIQRRAAEALCRTVSMASNILRHLANQNNEEAAEAIWDGGMKMVKAIDELADKRPHLLIPRARKSLVMPSLRSEVTKYSHDFERRAAAIELGRDSSVKSGRDANYSLDSEITWFVASLIQEAEEKRELLQGVAYFLDQTKPSWRKSQKTREESLRWLPGINSEHMGYLDLPPYGKATVKIWWENCIKPQLDSKDVLARIAGTTLLKVIQQGARSPKDYHLIDYLKKQCWERVRKSLVP